MNVSEVTLNQNFSAERIEKKFVILDEEYLSKFDEVVVIGDIHGCCDEFRELLHKIHSESPSKNPDKSLKLLVGDLINKGPKNEEVLDICTNIYPNSILAVRGNHEEVVLREHYAFKLGKALRPGNEWIEKISSKYLRYLEDLPYTIKIPSLNCIIVHAGLQPDIDDPAKNTKLDLMTTMRNIEVIVDESGEISLHPTKLKDTGHAWASFWKGPEHVYFGHDARRRLQTEHKFATGLDTGCVYGDRLSCVYVKGSRRGEIVSIKAKKIYEPVQND